MIRYDIIWYDMIWYDEIWYDMIWYDMIWYDMMWCDVGWYGANPCSYIWPSGSCGGFTQSWCRCYPQEWYGYTSHTHIYVWSHSITSWHVHVESCHVHSCVACSCSWGSAESRICNRGAYCPGMWKMCCMYAWSQGTTALDIALKRGYQRCVKLLQAPPQVWHTHPQHTLGDESIP